VSEFCPCENKKNRELAIGVFDFVNSLIRIPLYPIAVKIIKYSVDYNGFNYFNNRPDMYSKRNIKVGGIDFSLKTPLGSVFRY